MADRSGKSGSSYRFPLLGLLNHCRWWLQLWNQKTIFSCQETYDKPRQWVEKQRITLSTKICIVRAIPVVTYSCDSWTLSKAKHQRINAFELWFWRRLLKVPGTARISNKSILKEINPEYSLEGQMLKLKLQYFGHLMWKAYSLEKTLMLGRLKIKRRRGWQKMR